VASTSPSWQEPSRLGHDEVVASATEVTPGTRERLRRAAWVVVPCLVLVVLHVLFALSRDRPLIFADEAGYIGNARYLAGGLPIKMLKSGAYYPGYSLLLTPLFWLGLSAPHTYQAILILNGLMVSSAFVSLVYWIRWVLGDRSRHGYAIALVASLYPTFFVQPGFAMSESAVFAVTAALPLVAHRLLTHKRLTTAIAFAALTAFLYAIHPRFVGTVGTVAIGLALLTARRVLSWRITLASWLVLAAGVVGAKALTAYVTAANGGGSFEASNRLATLVTGPGFLSLTLEALGQFWYLEAATAGFVLIGVVALGRLLLAPATSPRLASPPWVTIAFTALGTILAFGVSCAFMSEPQRVDHYIYGRYNEGVLAPVLATGIWAVIMFGKSWRRHAAASGVVAAGTVLVAVILYWARGDAWSEHANLANILALIPYMKLVSGLKLVTISVVACGIYVLVSVAMRWRPWLGLSLLGVAFVTAAVFSQRSFLSMQRGRATRQVLFDRAAKMPELDNISYDASYFDPVTLFFGQYFLPNTKFDVFESERGEKPRSPYVLSHQKWTDAEALDAKLLGRDKWGYSLWSAGDCCQASALPFLPLGSAPVPGVEESGFYAAESWPIGRVRWTSGRATLKVPIRSELLSSSSLYVDIANVGQPRNRVTISANGRELFNGRMASGRARLVLPLAGTLAEDALEIVIGSKTFVPAEASGSDDQRQLGIAIHGVRIVRECCVSGRDPFGLEE
jgi:hypothetical protein